jgi:hypothetical protein
MSVADGSHLIRIIPWIINDFNSRPHVSLDGLTPNERYGNLSLDIESLRKMKKVASQEMKQHNLKNRFAACQD